jgi:hypothetical protein
MALEGFWEICYYTIFKSKTSGFAKDLERYGRENS